MLDIRFAYIWLVLIIGAGFVSASAQVLDSNEFPPSNMATYQTLAGECLRPPTAGLDSFVLDADERMPYLLSYMFDRWSAENKTVHVVDSIGLAGPLLRYRVGNADISYARRGRRLLERAVSLTMEVRTQDSAGILLYDELCEKSRTDVVERKVVNALSSAGYPETQAPAPEGSLLRRYAEPAVLTVAMGAVVYLFFTVRSAGE